MSCLSENETPFLEAQQPGLSSSHEAIDEDSSTGIHSRETFYAQNRGLLIIALSQLFFSMMYMGVKILATLDTPVPTFELVAVRMGMTWICCQAYMLATGVPNPLLGPSGVRLWLVIRGVVGFVGIFGLYYSLQYMSLSDAVVLTFLAPSTTAALGFLFLGEVVSWRQGIAGLASLSGVVLIAHPQALFGDKHEDRSEVTEAQRMFAVCVGLAGVFATSVAYTSVRAIGKRAHPMHVISYYSLWCVILGTFGISATNRPWVWPTRPAWLATLLLVGLFGFFAQLFLTVGLQRETASRGTLALYLQIVFTIVFEYIAFRTIPSMSSVLGAVLIIASAIYVALNKIHVEASVPHQSEEVEALREHGQDGHV
ncbi:drug/metabolite transporter superfamily [Ceratobasidium sp. AG-I]|nr:drug/metabolite transporter superfamily [Ceratobasidium sp. AG-I]